MSIQAIGWAMKQRVARSSEKFVLVCLANYADENGVCFPSIAALQDDTSQDRKTVIRGLQGLIEGGYVCDTGERAGVTRQITVYRLNLSNSPESGTVPPPRDGPNIGTVPKTEQFRYSTETVPFFPGKSPKFPRKGSQKRDTEPSGTVKEPSGTDRKRAVRANPRPDDVPDAIWSQYLAVRKAKRAPVTELAIAGIRREADRAGLTMAEALTVCCEQSWQGFNAGWYANLQQRSTVTTGPPRGLTASQQLQQTTIAGLTGRRTTGTIDVDATEVLTPFRLR